MKYTVLTFSILIALTAVVVMGGYALLRPEPADWSVLQTGNTGQTLLAVTPGIVLGDSTDVPSVSDKPESEPPHPVSLPALMEKEYNGSDLALGPVLAQTASYTRYYATYTSGDLTISGIMNVPSGEGPFPALVLNHGYIDTSVYTNGRGLKREQDYLARQGFVVLHTDYRNHADSDTDDRDALAVRLSYAEDAINAVYALKSSGLPYVDAEHIGMLGHSMGGGVTLNTLVAQPDLVQAAVLYAPVSGDMRLSYDRWLSKRPQAAESIAENYGTPDQAPNFWDNLSAVSFYDRIQAPIRIYHGTADDSVPLAWSETTLSELQEEGVQAELTIYPGAPHEFASNWTDFMQTTAEFFKEAL